MVLSEIFYPAGWKAFYKLYFRIVGRIGEPILDCIKSSSVSEMFELIPYASHRESLSCLLRSDVSLLIIDDAPANRGILTGKLFEYIGSGNPILALAPEGEAAELIRSKNLGWVVPPKDVRAIRNTLHQLIEVRIKSFKLTRGFEPSLKTKPNQEVGENSG